MMHAGTPGEPARHASVWRSAALFWSSLLLSLCACALCYRVSSPPADLCADRLVDARSQATVALPAHVAPDRSGDTTLVLEHRFVVDGNRWPHPALYLSGISPFLAVRLNTRDLTPGVDLGRRDRRAPGPHLYPLPKDALRVEGNVLTLRLPVSAALGGAHVGMFCVGDERALLPAWRANWWRQVGMPSLSLALFIVLAVTSLALSRLHRGVAAWFWYSACLSMMVLRTAGLVSTHMPGGVDLWRAAGDLGTLLLVFSIYRLMTLFWGVGRNRWSPAWLVISATVRIAAIASGWDLSHPLLDMGYWLSVGAVATTFLFEVSVRVRHAPAVERRGMQWVLLFAIACGMLEVIPLHLDANPHLNGVFVIGCAAVALMFGFLLVRRSLLGTTLLAHATRRLGHELDLALLAPPEHSESMWNELSSGIAISERQRVLYDIHAGFGARMLAVLDQIRHEHPDSRLNIEIQRALLDLRLMIDAMDEASQSIRSALGTLQQRMESPLAAAGICGAWDIAHVSDLQVNNRRKLMELFRCLEELLSNVVQHARASRVLVVGRSHGAQLVLSVEDDGCGFAPDQAQGRGLRNVRTRMRSLEGEIGFATGEHGRGSRVDLSVPRI